jgi:GT2 family glycosyltransferase
MIPALIVPILNQPELLVKMLASINQPVEQIIVIDNGRAIGESHPPLVGCGVEATTVHLPCNLGVAASWNLGIKLTPHAPYWLIVNHDIEFGLGDLARLEEQIDPREAGVWLIFGLAAFAITRHTINAVGFFDEGIHPAYNEDLDFMRRVDLLGLPRHEVGFTGTHVGSATIHSDPVLRAANGFTHAANDRYYERKWGGPKLGGETFSTPFNRGGHMGDWRLDLETLRANAWPRR